MAFESDKYVVTNGNVILIEPNAVNVNRSEVDGVQFVNGIPQYQDMYIFAELTAQSRGRTVIVNGNVTSTTSKAINLMGNADQQTPESPNYLRFTTDYYDGSTGNHTQYEGFGINHIKITTNSSFIPQINIQFVDIRGLAFFNQKDSPYRVLFDFPPPIFTLKVKGYYGKALTYQIHLVKYTSEFSAENGNFVIDAQFVAMTFAPLTDILFRYVVNFPLIDNADSMKPEAGVEPKNTYELILKLKNLYSAITDKVKTDTETKKYDNTLKEIEYVKLGVDAIKEYNQNETLKNNVPYLIIKDNTPQNFVVSNASTQANETSKIRLITSLSEYDELIKKENTTGTQTNLMNRLYVAYVAGTNLPAPDENAPYVNTEDTGKINDLKKYLDSYREILIKNINPSLLINGNDIPKSNTFFGDKSIASTPPQDTSTQYVGLDVTEYYYKLYKKNEELLKRKTELGSGIAVKINNMVSERLGMTPSVYNIFKVILNDVDYFFDKLRSTSQLAETEHEKEKDIISSGNDSSDVKNTKIYAFPLVITTSPVYGGTKEERIAPIELSQKANFPELKLVQDFIDTFQAQSEIAEQFDMRSQQNDDGTYKWIPVSPYDSTLGGASPESPYMSMNDDIMNEIYQTLLKRFYILTQGTINDDFYNTTKRTVANNAYVTLYANAEAANLATALLNSKNTDLIKTTIAKFKGNPQAFYDEIKNVTDVYGETPINLYSFPQNTFQYFPISPNETSVGSSGLVYVDKNNSGFSGANIYTREIVLQEPPVTDDSSKPVDKFNSNAKEKFWTRIFGGNEAEVYYKFSQENVIYFRDVEKDDTKFDNVSFTTRYAANNENANAYVNTGKFPSSFKDAYNNGNNSFRAKSTKDKRKLNSNVNLMELWVNQLSWGGADYIGNDVKIYDKVIKSGSTFSAMFLLSNFGYTLSPFNIFPNELNDIVFNTPAAVEVPEYLPLYIGALVHAIEEGWENEILDSITGSTGVYNYFANKGYFVLADLHDVKKYLSKKDKALFKEEFISYYDSEYPSMLGRLREMYEKANDTTGATTTIAKYGSKKVAYDVLLNPKSEEKIENASNGLYFDIVKDLFTKGNIINFSQITFKMQDTPYNVGYDSLATLNETKALKDINNSFFTQFFDKLDSEIVAKQKQQKEEAEELRKTKGDIDVITQTYYSFKNINDKWLTGPESGSVQGYPFNGKKNHLIDNFAFVDRAMNPIGDTIINAEILAEMLEDPNLSVFSVLSQLLSLNGFEFFPIQNFMRVDSPESWVDSFKIDATGNYDTNTTAFVCMYIGGSSSYPSLPSNGFQTDGITNIVDPGVKDFSTSPPASQGTEDDIQTSNNSDFPWRQVRAFRVRFGEQNQSMFTNIKIDSKEYPETNESIQILSRLAGDNKENAPTPKGQNLYNLYENRSYRATITGLGNAMIQPTQYFQLENVPMFNGAYIILSVEHTIDANKMTTTFSGTKLLKYPVPRVLNPIAFTAFGAEINSQTAGQITQSMLVSDEEKTHYNAMYTLKIE